MGILNNAFNKKDKKMDTKAPLILSMPMFKGDSGGFKIILGTYG